MFDHELPVAAIPERSVVNIAHPEDEPFPVTVKHIYNATPRPGQITWDTDQGSVTLSAARRVPVNLPASKGGAADGVQHQVPPARPRRR